jgi:hypothetical protein
LPKGSIPTQKTDTDNNTRVRYQIGIWCPLIEASICRAEADTQASTFGPPAGKKQYLIFMAMSAAVFSSFSNTGKNFASFPAIPFFPEDPLKLKHQSAG